MDVSRGSCIKRRRMIWDPTAVLSLPHHPRNPSSVLWSFSTPPPPFFPSLSPLPFQIQQSSSRSPPLPPRCRDVASSPPAPPTPAAAPILSRSNPSPPRPSPPSSRHYTNLAAGPPLVLPAPERATHRVHRDCRGPAVRELEDGGGGQQPGAVGRRAAGLRAARARIPHWPRLPLRPRPRRGEASAYARAAAATGAWVFDVDETLLSNLPYYAQHGYGLELFDHREFDRWLETGEAPVIPSSLRLYREVRDLGFKTFLLTGRSEAHEGRKSCRGPAILLVSAGFSRHLADLISGFLLYLNLDYNMLVANWNNPAVWFRRVDQFDTIDLSDNEIVKLENFPFMYCPGSPHLITTYNEREEVTPRELSIRVPAILRSKDEEGVKGCRVAGAVNNYTSQLLTYGSSSQSPSCKSSRQYNLTEALLFLSHFMGDIHKMLAFIHVLS
ncbi:uncharacterized protein [Aegilops tauschii subsp. strangulata]|uniref:uncharacterized protein n=1 Tax=Aegilops tauschii subsp. strangulata TaxID=200361 RepID=UPI003CC88955